MPRCRQGFPQADCVRHLARASTKRCHPRYGSSKLGELKSKITIRAKNVQKDYSKSKDKTGEEENGGDETSDVEKNTPPVENKHRYSKEDCEPYSSQKAESEEPLHYDDGVVPF